MTDEQVDENVPEEDSVIDEVSPSTPEKTEFGIGSIADGKDDPIVDDPIDQWLQSISFDSTAEVPIPDTLVDQVIGQEDASLVIRKAAEQRRHMLMIGDPGTGKSMLAKAMTELMPSESLEDTMCYMNDDDENEPRIRTVPAGRGDRIVKDRREQLREQRERTSRTLMFVALLIGAALLIATIQSGEIITLLFGLFILAFGYMFIKNRLVSNDESRIPKLLVKRKRGDMPPFIDATGTLAGSLLGDVRHDPFQSGGMETPAHERVEAGAIHKAHGGVLFIDEINLLRLEEQQALLTAMQERAFPISGRSERSSGALTKTEAVPCDFILVAAGNLDAVQHMHPALRSRIRGYGYEVYVNSNMRDTARNRRRLIRFIAQEVRNEQNKKTGNPIPHFDRSAVEIILREAQRRAGR